MAKVLVLGANGFIGSHLVDRLVAAGHDVRAFGRFANKKPLFEPSTSVELVHGDFLNANDLREALKGIQVVYHLVSLTTPAASDNDPLVDIETNVRMSVELFRLCVAEGVEHVFFSSTGGAIYGDTKPSGSYKETDLPLPVSPYAIGKLTIERYLDYFQKKHGLNSTSLRISNPYGERQPFYRKQGVIPIFIENIIRHQPIVIYGDGSMSRDYVYAGDLAEAMARMATQRPEHNLYNLGSGQAVDLNRIVEILQGIAEESVEIVRKETPATFLQRVELDVSRVREEYGDFCTTDLEGGIQKTYDYIKKTIGEI